MTWSRHGREDAYVEFGNYSVNLNGSEIQIKNAEYTNKGLFRWKSERGFFRIKYPIQPIPV